MHKPTKVVSRLFLFVYFFSSFFSYSTLITYIWLWNLYEKLVAHIFEFLQYSGHISYLINRYLYILLRSPLMTLKKKGIKWKTQIVMNFLALYLSLPDCNASFLSSFVLFLIQKTLIFSLFSKHFSKKFISIIHLQIFSKAPIT